jgi:hypothetical protein
MNKAELSLGFSFDEKDIKISNSPCSAFSNISTTEEADSLPRKISKISIQMEELKNKSNDDTQEITEENEFDFNSKDFGFSKKEEDNSAEFEAYFYFQLNGENEFIFPVKSDSFNKNEQYAYELIKNIIKKINEKNITIKYNNTNYTVYIKDEQDTEDADFYTKNYELKPCKKKNFKPKSDSPSYSPNSLLKNIDKNKISFVSKSPLNIMLIEKFEENEEENNKYHHYYDDED